MFWKGEKGRLVTFGAFCGYGLGKSWFLVAANTQTHPASAMVRAACYGTPDFRVDAFKMLRQKRSAFEICRAVRIRPGFDRGQSPASASCICFHRIFAQNERAGRRKRAACKKEPSLRMVPFCLFIVYAHAIPSVRHFSSASSCPCRAAAMYQRFACSASRTVPIPAS